MKLHDTDYKRATMTFQDRVFQCTSILLVNIYYLCGLKEIIQQVGFKFVSMCVLVIKRERKRYGTFSFLFEKFQNPRFFKEHLNSRKQKKIIFSQT